MPEVFNALEKKEEKTSYYLQYILHWCGVSEAECRNGSRMIIIITMFASIKIKRTFECAPVRRRTIVVSFAMAEVAAEAATFSHVPRCIALRCRSRI